MRSALFGIIALALTYSAHPVALAAQGLDQRGVIASQSVPVLPDFYVVAHVDVPNMQTGIPFVSKSAGPLVVGAWAFECRSGLQPSTQRVGDLALSLTNSNTGETPAYTVKTINGAGARPDVGAAYTGACPALGANAGFSMTVDISRVPPGMYQLQLLADAFDYVGRYAWYRPAAVTVIITE